MNFLTPMFLYGLAAVTIPIIIHLVELRRARKILFTNVAFIKEVKNITASHRKLKEILILLARIGFIIALVFAFAQPYIPANTIGVSKNKNVKIYLDNSFSLQNESETAGRNIFDVALGHSQNILNSLNSNTSYNILDNSAASNFYTNYDKIKAKAHISGLQLFPSSKSANTVLSNFNSANTGTYDGIVYSDFQKNNIKPDVFKQLNESDNFYFIYLKGTAEANALVDSVYLDDEFIRLNENNKIRVRVKNTGIKNIDNCNVKFFIGEQQVSALNIEIPAKQFAAFDLNYRITDNEVKKCRIELQDFPMEFDNTYYFTLQASSKINIIDVSENGISNIGRLYTNEPLFNYQNVTPAQFNYTLLKDANLVVLNSLTNLQPAFADNLSQYLKEGGHIAFIPSEKAEANKVNSFFTRLGIGSINLNNGLSDKPYQAEMAIPDKNNPFFNNIFDVQNTKISMPKAAKIYNWSRASADILKFRDGGNFLSAFNKGGGSLYMFASPIQESYTDFGNHALFVPVLYKIALQSFSSKQNLAYTLGKDAVTFPVTGKNNQEVFKLVKDGKMIFTVPSEITEAGFYQLKGAGKPLALFAFNYNKKESELDNYSVEDLKAMASGKKNVQILEADDEVAIKKIFTDGNIGSQLWKYCLILCLVFAFTEILLIRFM